MRSCSRRQRAVRDGDPQHVGVELQIDAVHQPQRLELLLGQFARKAARDLIAEFRNALGDQRAIECVVDVHGAPFRLAERPRSPKSPAARWSDRASRMSSRRLPGRTWPSAVELDRRHIGADRAEVVGDRGRRAVRERRRRRSSTAASSRSVVQPPSARAIDHGAVADAVGGHHDRPGDFDFLVERRCHRSLTCKGGIGKIASENPAMGNTFLYRVRFSAANSRIFCQDGCVRQQVPPGRRGETGRNWSCRTAAVIRRGTALTIRAIAA